MHVTRVDVTDQLSANLDWTTLEFTEFGFGDTLVSVPEGRANHFETVALTYNNRTFDVQVELTLDAATGLVTAVFQSIDPLTNLPPEVLTGFLPPEDGTGIGKAHFSYSIRAKTGLATGTELRNIALIRFDRQTSIATNQVDPEDPSKGIDRAKEALNTIDAVGPSSRVSALPALQNANFILQWSGADDAGGSGVATFSVFVSDNGGPFTAFQTNTAATSALFNGQPGHTYRFYTLASDNVGHVEAAPGAPNTFTQISTQPWHNVIQALDVTGPAGQVDETITPADALEIINYLNAFGLGQVPDSATPGPPYYDTSGDGFVLPADALNVINFINAFGSGLPGPAGAGEGPTAISPVSAANGLRPTLSPDSQLSDLVFADIASDSRSQRPLAQVGITPVLSLRQNISQKTSSGVVLRPSVEAHPTKSSTVALDQFFSELVPKPPTRTGPTAWRGRIRRHL